MVAIFLILFSVLKVVSIVDSINTNLIEEKYMISEIHNSLSWLVIESVILDTNN